MTPNQPAQPTPIKYSARDTQRKAAKKIVKAANKGTGTTLTPDEVYELWAGLMDHLLDTADDNK